MLTKTILSFLLLLLSTIACNSVEPPPDGNGTDTTGHNFTFETFKFGEHSSSILYDVVIINENSIYAVGEIYMNDSLGQPDSKRYNALIWNGNNWSVLRVPYHYQGTDFFHPIQSILAFSANDIWFCGNGLIHWDGNDFIPISVPTNVWGPYQMNKLWGKSSQDLYVVGNNGSIAHFTGTGWIKIESGTNLDVYNILGNQSSEENYEILCVAAKLGITTEKKIFKIANGAVIDLPTSGIPSSLKGIWFKPGKKYYVVGSGMFAKTDIYSSNGWLAIWQGVTESYTGSIDGNDLNDIVVCGSYGEILHFNGNNWKSFKSELQLQSGTYGEVKIKDNLIIAVGHKSSQAVITIGSRQLIN